MTQTAPKPRPKFSRDSEANARAVIECFRGSPGEYEMLKGVLCLSHAFDVGHDFGIDTRLIAARMSEHFAEAVDRIEGKVTP